MDLRIGDAERKKNNVAREVSLKEPKQFETRRMRSQKKCIHEKHN